jgi:hypothetical protein
MRRRKRRLFLSAVGLGAAAAITAGALSTIGGGDASGPPGFTPVQYADAKGPSAALAGIDASTLEGALQQLRARLADDRVTAADVRALPTTPSNAGGQTALLTVGAASRGAPAIRATWEGELLAGALRDAAAEQGLGALDNFEISLRLPNGTVVPDDSGFGNVAPSQRFETSPAPIERRIRTGLADVGLKPLSISFVSVLQPAPVVIAQSNDPAAVIEASHDARWWSKMLGSYDNYEGYYVEFRDASGDPFGISTAAHRAGSSSGWIRPDLSPRLPVKPLPTGNNGG